MARSTAAERLVVGLVRGVHGLAGAVRVEVLSDEPERFAPGSVLHRETDDAPLTVAWRQADGPGLLVRFREIVSRESAEALRGAYLVTEGAATTLPEGAAWWHEVVGAQVTTTAGEELGAVVDLFRSGGGEVLVVEGGARGEVLVPLVSAIVVEFAPREGRVLVDGDALGLEAPVPRRPRGRRSSKAARTTGTA
jgi:16S rRNA processing protein RimM